jgi:hypothetical protein
MRFPAQALKRIQVTRDGQAPNGDELQGMATILAVFVKLIPDFWEQGLSS